MALQNKPNQQGQLEYALMPNHWHFVLWPARDGEVTAFLRWLTHTHTQRWHAHYHTAGTGHLYQGRFKSFPIQEDEHLYTVLRYVERNALRARLVARAEQWRWSSLAHRRSSGADPVRSLLHAWPLPLPRDWLARVQRPETEAELEAVRRALQRGQPFGSEAWQERTAKELNLEYTLQRRGRPRRAQADEKGPRPLFLPPTWPPAATSAARPWSSRARTSPAC